MLFGVSLTKYFEITQSEEIECGKTFNKNNFHGKYSTPYRALKSYATAA